MTQAKPEQVMTPAQIKPVQQSFAKIAPIADKAAEMFYGRLFEIAPQVRKLFPDDMAEQRKKLMATLAIVVNGLDNMDAILPAAGALAKRHVAYGAQAAHYPVVGEALLWTLEKAVGRSWTPEVAAAWASAYSALSSFMINTARSQESAT
jgi:nitric oxide dioxygenase